MRDTNTLPLDGERLLQIARGTGLRHHLHGVEPAGARALLTRFIAAVCAAQRAVAQAPADGLVTLSACTDEYLDGVRAPFVVQRRDDPIAYVFDLSDGERIVAAFNDLNAAAPKAYQLDAIDGAITFGASGVNAPPAGHWLQRFWDIGSDQAAVRDQALQEAAAKMDARYNAVTGNQEYDKGRRDAYDVAESDILALKDTPTAAVADAQPVTYSSTQATNCAGCGERKHTPLRIDAMGGYVCLTCIDKKLGGLLGEFGYECEAAPQPSTNPGPLAAVELPDAVRVPLDSLHADAGYLIGRVIDGTMSRDVATGVIRSRIDAAIAASKEGASHGG